MKSQIASIFDPDLTPSARMLADMRDNDEGFFHHAKRMSQHHYHYYKNHSLPDDKVRFFENLTKDSLAQQKKTEAEDDVSFDAYLENYFKEV